MDKGCLVTQIIVDFVPGFQKINLCLHGLKNIKTEWKV